MSRQPAWRREGEEPDYRFTLANERTFLAWIRTALAVLAGGVLLEQFATHLQLRRLVSAIALLMCALAAALCVLAYRRWRANEIAMRRKGPLPATAALAVLAAGMSLVAVQLLGLVLWFSR
jgi:putative membrane protein